MMRDDTVVYKAHPHWIVFHRPVILLFFALYGAYFYPKLSLVPLLGMQDTVLLRPWLIMAFIALIWFAGIWLMCRYSSLTITKSQIILCVGVLVRETIGVSLSKVESIDIRQPLLGRLLRYGAIIITGTGGTRQVFNYLNQPLTCRRCIEQLMQD